MTSYPRIQMTSYPQMTAPARSPSREFSFSYEEVEDLELELKQLVSQCNFEVASDCDFQDTVTYCSNYSPLSYPSSPSECYSDDFNNFDNRSEFLNTVYTIKKGVWTCDERIICETKEVIEQEELLKSSYIITHNQWFCNKEI